jgi:hypothetical protein
MARSPTTACPEPFVTGAKRPWRLRALHVHSAAAAPHPPFKRFDRPVRRILVHVHVRAVVAVEAINCNRMDAVLACWRGPSGWWFLCSLIMEASSCSKSDSFRSSCARRSSASLAFMLRLRKAFATLLCLTTARPAFATRASASAGQQPMPGDHRLASFGPQWHRSRSISNAFNSQYGRVLSFTFIQLLGPGRR